MKSDTAIPDTMRAFVLHGHGEMDALVYSDTHPTPKPASDQVLIRVHACGLNNTDVNTRTGWYSSAVTSGTTGGALTAADDQDATWGGDSIGFPRIQGADVAGTVVAVGANANQSLIGKRVMVDTWIRNYDDPFDFNNCGYFGSECDGGFADYTVVDQRQVHLVNSSLKHAELATFATSYATAENMLNRAMVGEGDTVLIPGASGGVGTALIQLAKRRGAVTVAMASRSKHEGVSRIKPDALLDRSPEDLGQALFDAIGSREVSVVADVVGGDYWNTLMSVIERGGRYTCAGAIAGPIVEFDLRSFYLRDLTLTGATIVPPGVFADLVRYIEDSEIEPLLAATYPLSELHAAQQAFIDKQHVGNIVVTMDDD